MATVVMERFKLVGSRPLLFALQPPYNLTMTEKSFPISSRIVLYTTSWCSDCHRAKYLLDEHGIAYEEVDIEQNPEGLLFVQRVNGGQRSVPTILFPDGSMLVEPSTAQLAQKTGIDIDGVW